MKFLTTINKWLFRLAAVMLAALIGVLTIIGVLTLSLERDGLLMSGKACDTRVEDAIDSMCSPWLCREYGEHCPPGARW